MGKPQKDQRRPETGTATTERPDAKAEKNETSPKGTTLHGLRERAERLRSDPNFKASEAIRNVKGSLETVQQIEGLSALNHALSSILVRLAKAGIDIRIDKTEDLEKAVNDAKLAGKLPNELSMPEEAAMQNINRILREGGPTASSIRRGWPKQVETAMEASKGSTSKVWNYMRKNPASSLLFFAAGVSGIILGYYAIKKIAKRSFTDGKDSWFSPEIMIPLGIMLAAGAGGGLLSVDTVKEICAKHGLDYADVVDKARTGEPLDEDKKERVKKASKEVQDRIEDMRRRGKGKDGERGDSTATSAKEETSEEPAAETSENEPEKAPADVIIDGEHVPTKELIEIERYNATARALVSLYRINLEAEKYNKLSPDMIAAFVFLADVSVNKAIAAYEKAKDRQTISPDELGLSNDLGVSDEAYYHACAIIATAFKEAQELHKIKQPNRTDTIQTFLGHLGGDPALNISNNLQDSIEKKIVSMHITSPLELHDKAAEVFDTKAIEAEFIGEKNELKAEFVEYLAKKYKIDLDQLDKTEKASFFAFIAKLYAYGYKLDQPEAAIEKISGFGASPKVAKVSKEFLTALKADVAILVPKCVERYDIQRPDEPDFDRILQKNFNMGMLHFSDGLQMALVSDGIQFGKTSNYESVGQAKDITMIFLIVNILKKRDRIGAHAKYLSNVIDLGSKGKINIDLNLNFIKLQPYFEKLLKMLCQQSEYWLIERYNMVMGLSDTYYEKNRADVLDEKGTGEFVLDATRSGGRALVGIPAELISTLAGEFPGCINAKSTAEEVLKFSLTLGSSISFPVEGQLRGMVYLFGKTYFLRPIGAPLSALADGIKKESAGVFVKSFLVGTSPYILLGATSGMARAARVHGLWHWRTAAGTLWGAGRGVAAPITMPAAGIRHVTSLSRGARYLSNVGGSVVNFEMSSDLFLRYSNMVFNESSGNLEIAKEFVKSPYHQGKKVVWGDIYESMRLTWAQKSAINWNAFYGLKPEAKQVRTNIPKGGESTFQPLRVKNMALYDDDFVLRMTRLRDVLNKLRTIKDMEEIKTEAELLAKFKEVGLNEIEINTLRAKMNKPEWGFEKFRTNLTEELGKGNRPGFIRRLKEFYRSRKADSAGTGEGTGEAGTSEPGAAKPGTSEPTAAESAKSTAETRQPVRAHTKELKYQYGNEVIELTNDEIRKMTDSGLNRDEAIKALCEEKWQAIHPTTAGERAAAETADETAKAAAKAADTAEEATPSRLSRLKQHMLGETLATSGGADKVVEAAGKDIESVRKKAADANKLLEDLAKARDTAGSEGAGIEKINDQIARARKIIEDCEKAEFELQRTAESASNVKKAKEALDAARKAKEPVADIARLQTELRSATLATEEVMRTSSRAVEGLGRFGKIAKVGKGVWSVAGKTFVIGGAVFSSIEAVSSAYEAVTTNVKGRGAIKGAEAGLWSLNAVADGAAVAVMFGSESVAVGYLSSAALPLVPLTYAGTTVAETLYEETKTEYEWAQESGGNPYTLLHHFYTSVNSVSLGDAWVTAGIESQIERSKTAKHETMHKIFRGLIAFQKDPALLDDIRGGKIPPEQIEKRIDEKYTKYHEFYFRDMNVSNMQSYSSAQRFILEAQMFDDVMQKRDEAKAKKEPFIIMGKDKRPYNLHLDRYDVLGGTDNPHGKVEYQPSHIVEAYKETMVQMFERDPIRKGNLERMDSAYLIRLYVQICKAIGNEANKSEFEANSGLIEMLSGQAQILSGYLKMTRNVNMTFATGEREYHEPAMNLEEILKHLESMDSYENKAFLDYEKDNYQMTPALQAVYRLGEYFGYTGQPSEKGLKDFFHKNAASYHGFYWDGSEWCLQERGNEIDESFGPVLSTLAIEKIIKMMREEPDNILEHRSDTIFVDAYDYTTDVNRMANALENGLKEGSQRNYKRSEAENKEKETATPIAFNPMEIKYDQPPEALKKSYAQAIEYTKNQTGWTQLNYTVKDENVITLSRGDGSANVELTRSGETWSVGGYVDKVSLIQAVALGNLKNWTAQWLEKEKIKGGSSRPFEVDGYVIDFDVSGSPFDRNVLENWVGFYNQINVSKKMAVDMLNNWFEKEGPKG